MAGARIVLVILDLLLVARAQADPPTVALLDISQSDPDWRDQDLRLLERLRAGLADADGISMVPAGRVAALFREKTTIDVASLHAKARTHLARGKELSARLKPRKAIEEFSEALRILRAVFPFLDDLGDLEDAHFQLGMTFQALGKERPAERQYRMVLLLDPDRQLDEATVNPVVVERFGQVRERLLTSMKGSVSLLSKPEGARVFMDGEPAGRTPITIPGVTPGDHYFAMEHEGYKTWFGVVRVEPEAMEKREVFLVEGESVRWVRLRNRMAAAGMGQVPAASARELTQALGCDWLLLVALSHLGGKTMLEVGLFERGTTQVSPLGVFPAPGGDPADVVQRVRRWIGGERRTPHKTFVRRKKDAGAGGVAGGGTRPPPPSPPPPPDGTSWYESWWFWTAVGVVVTGAAATTTALLLTRDSGIQLEVIR